MTEKLAELLWSWIVLVEKRLAEAMCGTATRYAEDAERELAVAELRGALLALGYAVPTVDELRARWADDERRGRDLGNVLPSITEVEE